MEQGQRQEPQPLGHLFPLVEVEREHQTEEGVELVQQVAQGRELERLVALDLVELVEQD